jgi:hypothetical protein
LQRSFQFRHPGRELMRKANPCAAIWLALTSSEAADTGRAPGGGYDGIRAAEGICRTDIDLDSDGDVDRRSVLRQDADGDPLDQTWTDASGAIIAVQTWTYDADGRVSGYARDDGPDGTDDIVAVIGYGPDGRTETKTTYGYVPPQGLGYDLVETWDWDRSGRLVTFTRIQRTATSDVESYTQYRLDDAGDLVGYLRGTSGEEWSEGFVLDGGGRPLEYRVKLLTGDVVWSYQWSDQRLVRSEVAGVEQTPATTTWIADCGLVRRADVDEGNDGQIDATIDYTVDARGRVLRTEGTSPAFNLTWGDDGRLAERIRDYGDSRETERFEWDEGRIVRYEHGRRYGPHNVETWTYAEGGDVTGYERIEDGVAQVRYTYDDDGNLLSQYTAGDWWAFPVDATYAYSGECKCQRGIAPQFASIGPGPSRPCDGDEEVSLNWRLPDRPEPEYAGGGLSSAHTTGTSAHPDP